MSLEQAHAAMMADPTLQHTLPGIPKPKPPPDWLSGFFELIAGILPALSYVFYALLAVGVALVVFFIAREIIGVRFGWKREKRVVLGQTDWRPDREKARVLLQDADAMAAEGRYDEAVHALLLRGVEDIIARRPRLIGPSLTSRDIADLPDLPEAARPPFRLIAEIVERSWFGGRPVDRDGWLTARKAYEDLIFTGSWS